MEAGLPAGSDRYTEEITALVAEVFHIDAGRAAGGLAFGDIPEWDSLGHMDLLMTLEARYQLELNEDLITRLTSVQAICEFLDGRGHA